MNSRVKRYARRLSGKRLFQPSGITTTNTPKVTIELDEFEAIRLVDYEGLSQIEASEEMEVSRATIQRLLLKARKKTVGAILNNHILEVKNEIDNIKLKGENKYDIASKGQIIIAFPSNDQETIYSHFGKASYFTICTIENTVITSIAHLAPPPHAPGVIPQFLQEHNVDVIITTNMGKRAVQLFGEQEIDIILGASGNIIDNLNEYLQGFLKKE